MSVVIETTKGIFTVDLYVKQRPKGKSFLDQLILVTQIIGTIYF